MRKKERRRCVRYHSPQPVHERPPSPGGRTAALLPDARVVVGLITLVGAALRFAGLGAKPLWLDEAVI